MIEWLISLIPGLPRAAALGIGLAMFSGQAHGESHEPRTCRIALLASAGSLFAVLALIASRLTGELPETVLLGNWLNSGSLQTVSYTHLDVYKRQVHGSAWRLFRLAQHLGLSGGELRALAPADREQLLAVLDELPSARRGALWQAAYEHHYRTALINALANNHGRWSPHQRDSLQAQVVFCIDCLLYTSRCV